jgi:hypothetical protein
MVDENNQEREFSTSTTISRDRLPRSAFASLGDTGRRQLTAQNGYGNWTSNGFGACEGDSANRDWFWRTSIDINEIGEYVKL